MKKNFILITTALILLFNLTSCVKEGPQGPPGKDGINGLNGQDGQDGNANVKTTVFQVTPSDWTQTSSDIYYLKYLSIITNDIVDNGAVLVYWKSTNSNSYQALPMTWPSSNTKIYRYWYSSTLLEVEIVQADGTTPTLPSTTYTYKVVAIEGDYASRPLPINIKNYSEVKKYFNLKD